MSRYAAARATARTRRSGFSLFLMLCAVVAGQPADGQDSASAAGGSAWQERTAPASRDFAGRGVIEWRTGAAVNTRQDAAEMTAVIEAGLARGARHFVVHFDRPVGAAVRGRLESAGAALLSYLGDNAFFASVTPGQLDVDTLSAAVGLMNVRAIERRWKLHPTLNRGEAPSWTVVGSDTAGNPIVATYVVFHRDVALDVEAPPVCLRHGAAIRSQLRTVNALVVELPFAAIATLADEDAVQWIEPALPPLTATNDSNRQITQADDVQAPPYELDGSGVSVLVYDVGNVDPEHPDFTGRLALGDAAGLSNHSTHVAGTVGGDGAASGGLYRGMAPGVSLISYAFGWEAVGVPLYADPGDIERDYREAIQTFGVDLATNSIGTNTCRNGFDCEITGDYGVTASLIDAIVRGEVGEPLIVFWANGNERSCQRCRDEGVHTPEGYHSTAPPACAKNHITIGALNSNDDSVTFFTSWGPTDDGRLKPDIAAPGCQTTDDEGVTSCIVGGGYETYCGTSMATPTVAGLGALLLEDLYNRFPDRPRPRNASFKVLLVHNAVDLGHAGPDYQSGFGSVRIRDTIEFARTGSFFEDQVDHGETYAFLARVAPEDVQLKATLAWDDVPGTVNVEPALVNDLDLLVYDPSHARYFPWTLDPNDPATPAVRTQADHVNNIEQVLVDLPTPGLWTIYVSGFNVPQGPQPFSICASPQLSRDCDDDGIPDDEEILADPSLDCTGNGILDICEPDCNDNGVADSCDIADGTSTDCDGNGVPDECQPDCNGNGIADACDILDGTSADCDANGVPDECQDTSADCNENGVWDACDIADGTSADENYNGIPDECEENRTIYVDDDGPFDPGPGDPLVSDPDEDGSPQHPYDAIQEAIDAALDGDGIVLADGHYSGPGNTDLDFSGKNAVLSSASGAENCVVDCEGVFRGFSFVSGETPATRIEGLTIRGGYDFFWGGAVFCEESSPTITDCIFEDAWALVGGAVYVRQGDPAITNCVFTNNWAGYGSGAFITLESSPALTDCTFVGNTAMLGGGALTLFGKGTARVSDCGFFENQTTGSDSSAGEGGAVLIAGNPVLMGCVFTDNFCLGNGGAIHTRAGSRATLTNCAFLANAALGPFASGGAISSRDSSPTLIGCTLRGNQAEHHGGGIEFAYDGAPALSNCILWGNVDSGGTDESAQIHDNGGFAVVRYCCIQGLSGMLGGVGNIGADPLFVDADSGDYHLSLGSPCVNRGDPDFLAVPDETDIDGDPRVLLDRVDIGADEFVYQEEDCNGNGIPDEQDIADGTSPDCNENDIPDECELALGLAADCNANGVLDDCDIAEGASQDCSGNGVPDECEPDCNGNGEPDDCDILNGISADCNENGLPDECEPDCNGNGLADECDLLTGGSTDFNNNAIPDECEANRIIHVDDDGPYDPGPGEPWPSDPNEDGSSAHPFDAIQEAVDAAIPGDVVLLADGVYAGNGNRNVQLRGRAITVRSESGPRNCIMDCEFRGRGFLFDERDASAARVEGLTITGGSVNQGGAIYCSESSPTVANCILIGNTSWYSPASGGGLLIRASDAVISNCLIAGNVGAGGGGIACTGPGRPKIQNCTIVGNHAEETGGGIHNRANSAVRIVNCIVCSNVAPLGPQISLVGSDTREYSDVTARPVTAARIAYCNIEDGQTNVYVAGYARLIWADGNLDADPRFVGGSSGTWTSEAVYDAATRQTTLIDANAAWMDDGLVGKLLQPDVAYYAQGLIAANTTTTVTLWGDYSDLGLPEVAYQVHDDHLRPCSPCIDAGRNATVPPPLLTDLDGNPRFVDDPFTLDTGYGTPPVVDIGAYEYQADCLGDLDGDRSVGVGDLVILLSAYGIDDAGDLDCDGVTGLSDLALLLRAYGTMCE